MYYVREMQRPDGGWKSVTIDTLLSESFDAIVLFIRQAMDHGNTVTLRKIDEDNG